MLNHRDYNFSSKDLCIRPRSGPSTRTGTPLYGGRTKDENLVENLDLLASEERKLVDKLEQQLRDALFARTTAHLGEQRILKSAFTKFDKDCSNSVDFKEFSLALEHLGLHQEDKGLPGQGGLPTAVVEALFKRYDADGSGQLEYNEFAAAIMQPSKMTKML